MWNVFFESNLYSTEDKPSKAELEVNIKELTLYKHCVINFQGLLTHPSKGEAGFRVEIAEIKTLIKDLLG